MLSAQVHWRERRLATDWESLVLQVERWQNNNGLGWNNQDVADVAQYLNNRFYGYPQRDGPTLSPLFSFIRQSGSWMPAFITSGPGHRRKAGRGARLSRPMAARPLIQGV
ncbi:MAG TPA: hypothetical protein VN667_22750 [Burkholderiales bacterium]|nr:hypothetical protein [Burkholderiales bacterium]